MSDLQDDSAAPFIVFDRQVGGYVASIDPVTAHPTYTAKKDTARRFTGPDWRDVWGSPRFVMERVKIDTLSGKD